ncbi:MAG: BrnA antitoxin family protein [Alphaproteobacteria bacterium]|nr:BrnA antitoxin family protein [Alphaproteobacteria bacterium]
MKDEHTGDTSTETTDWARLRRSAPSEIKAGLADDPDCVPTDPSFWDKAHVVQPRGKASVTIRVDADVLDWFRDQGRGYQTRMNAVLRSFVESRRHGSK